ncbi:hypothetical protein AYI68_g1352 [Smittium mucronatum]|uniref:Uncharacterized protein n=1 Tax=Smittium mucronatum TaxID=133383 RepID=A0A1R0H5T4_9FUNG|nr:hypothetical protein AYI68_g1352 [Smittium mucronatum]
MESNQGEDAYQLQRASISTLCSQDQERGRKFNVSTLSQHDYNSVFKKFWGKEFPKTTRDSGENMRTLPEKKYNVSGHICSFDAQYSRFAKQTERANRVVSITGGIKKLNLLYGQKYVVLFSSKSNKKINRCCAKKNQKKKDRGLIHLVPGHECIATELTDIQFFMFQQPLQLHTVEPDPTSIT